MLAVLAGRFLLFGFAGWVMEAIFHGKPGYSEVLGGDRYKVPVLPVYGVGGVLIGAMAPAVSKLAWPVQVATYGVTLSGLEYLACQADRTSGHHSWDYGQGKCIDLPHTLAWGAFGMLTGPSLLPPALLSP